jgi:hypothetical protein
MKIALLAVVERVAIRQNSRDDRGAAVRHSVTVLRFDGDKDAKR